MSIFPSFSNVNGFVVSELNRRVDNTAYVSSLNSWIRVASGVGDGLILQSNANFNLLAAAGGNASFYGNAGESGTLGTDWSGKAVKVGADVGLRPSPIVTSFECDEGGGTATLSRKATFKITAFTQRQCDAVCKYFLEPGFTIFIEWGWNQPSAFTDYREKLDANYVVSFTSIKVLQSKRQKCKGLYDNYLGFITGGSVAAVGDKWEITVNCTGFPELPAYLMISDNVIRKDVAKTNTSNNAIEFATSVIQNESQLGKRRFMQMFNQLPSNRRSAKIQQKLLKNPNMLKAFNYVNFDDAVQDEFQKLASGGVLAKAEGILTFGLVNGTTTVGVQDTYEVKDAEGNPIGKEKTNSVEIPDGTKLIGDEKYIRFGAIMEIINSIGAGGYVIGNKLVQFKIESRDCVCSAFDKIFSTDKARLFIPNPNTPKFSIAEALNNTTSQTDFSQIQNNSVEDDGFVINFPYPSAITNGVVSGTKSASNFRAGYKVGFTDAGLKASGIVKSKGQWGFLDDLYVNFEFVKGIIETKNFLMKDALYQILNGMSSAAGSVWDFQIVEQSNSSGSDVILKIVDLNFVSSEKDPLAGIMTLPMTGPNSVFIDAALDLDISGAKMNQIIGSRLGTKNNSSSPSTTGALFAVGLKDMVLQKMNVEAEVAKQTAASVGITDESIKTEDKSQPKKPDGTIEQGFGSKILGKTASAYNSIVGAFGVSTDNQLTIGLEQTKIDETNSEIEKAKEKTFQLFLEKVGIYPKVKYKKEDVVSLDASTIDLYDYVYIGALNDLTVFENLKLGYEVVADRADDNTGPIMPIEFTFTIHGVSGFKRGDKFRILGLPSKYSTSGFFQVMSVKHTMDNMTWKTEIKGGFRQVSVKSAIANSKKK